MKESEYKMNINKLKERIAKTVRRYRTNKDITISEAEQIISNTKNAVLIDVRSVQEYRESHINGAICIPHFEIQNRIEKEISDKNTLIILYCQSGIRSKKAGEMLAKKGYSNVYNIKNGLDG